MVQWRLPQVPTAPFCPSEVQGTVTVPRPTSTWRKFIALALDY